MGMTRSEAFRVLEVDSRASVEQIRSSYKRLALKWHPDKHSNSAEATEKFQEISEAYKRLTSTTDDDNIKISMGDMFDLFAHIFFTNGRYYATTRDHMAYSSDDDYMISSDSSDDHMPEFRPRPRSKYCDLHASRMASSNKNNNKKNNHNTGISEAEATKNAEELIKEEEKIKKKAEKRRAKKKRSRAKRKQREKEKKAEENRVDNSDEEQESDEDAREEREETKKPTDEQKPKNNTNNTTNTQQNKPTVEKSEEESHSEHDDSSWDTSSAFFANAARRGPVNNTNISNETNLSGSSEVTNGASRTSVQKENNSQTSRVDRQRGEDQEGDPVVIQSRQLAVRGNNLANEGKYPEAISYFSKAISLHDCDFRFFGNRSYCYDRLGEYSKALQDAEVTISLAPVWPKGYFRKGRALAGLKQYSDAETAFCQVLKLDKHCDDAKFELTRVRVQQLKDMGFAHGQSERAVRLYGTVHAALDALLSGKVKNVAVNEEETYVSDDGQDEQDEREERPRSEEQCSLWVGNVDPKEVTERQLTQLFSKYGPVKLIRILPGSFCAFVNYETSDDAAKALQYLQGCAVGGQNLRIRYPNNNKDPKSFDVGSKPSGPVNGDECYFWRTTGCAFGNKCRYAHIPAHRRIDLDKVEQKFGKIKPTKKGR